MRKIFLATAFVFVLTLSPRVCLADLGSEVRGMFDRLGLSGTATSAGVYEGQSRGFVTGGSVSVRLPNETIQPLSVSLPHLRSGCGGVDLFLGAISYISAEDLIRKMKAIGTSFASYAFMMALKTLCSPCENIMEKLEAHAAIVGNRRPQDDTVRFLDALPFPAWKLLSSAGAVDPEIGGTYVSALARPIAVFSVAAWLERAERSLWSGVGSSERKGTLSAMDRKKIAERMRMLREEVSLMMEQENTKIEELVYALSIIEHLDSRSPVVFERKSRHKAGDEVIQGAD